MCAWLLARPTAGLQPTGCGQALAQREELRDAAKMAETLNSIGALRQKQKSYKDAEANFVKSLELRRQGGGGEGGDEKAVAQAVAQSLTSLGTLLYLAMADECDPKDTGEGASAERVAERKRLHRSHLGLALKHLRGAKEAYVRGFSENHPKVAWALEGLAKAYQTNGEYREAQTAWEAAIAIRNQAQEASTGKQLFSAELERAHQSKASLESKRAEARGRFQLASNKKLLMGAAARAMGRSNSGRRPLLSEPLLEEPLLVSAAPSAAAGGSTSGATTEGDGDGHNGHTGRDGDARVGRAECGARGGQTVHETGHENGKRPLPPHAR